MLNKLLFSLDKTPPACVSLRSLRSFNSCIRRAHPLFSGISTVILKTRILYHPHFSKQPFQDTATGKQPNPPDFTHRKACFTPTAPPADQHEQYKKIALKFRRAKSALLRAVVLLGCSKNKQASFHLHFTSQHSSIAVTLLDEHIHRENAGIHLCSPILAKSGNVSQS